MHCFESHDDIATASCVVTEMALKLASAGLLHTTVMHARKADNIPEKLNYC